MVAIPTPGTAGFDLADLTASINMIPNTWGRLQGLNLMPPEGITLRTVAVDMVNETLNILPEREIGAPPTVGRAETRKVLTFQVPHIPHQEVLRPSDIQGRRAPGDIGPDTQTAAYDRKLFRGRRKFALTLEYLRMGALKGIIIGGSGNTIYNLYTEFGIAQKSVDFDLGDETTDVKAKVIEVLRHMEDNLVGETMSGARALVSSEFFDALTGHPKVAEAYKHYASGQQLLREDVRREFPFAGLILEEYRGSGTLVDGTTARFISAGEGHAFPLGTTDTFATYFAPADKLEFANTVGLESYAWPMPTPDGRGIQIEMESNPLPICRRPGLLVRLYSST